MKVNFTSTLIICLTILLVAQAEAQNRTQTGRPSTPSLLERIRGDISRPVLVAEVAHNSTANISSTNSSSVNDSAQDEDEDDEDQLDDDEDEDDEQDDDDDDEIEAVAAQIAAQKSHPNSTSVDSSRIVTDIFGNKIKLENNRTILVSQNKARDLGLLTIKAIILGPLIGLTIKAALIRGLLWAVGAYLLHLFFPALLTSLGLGTGLVGFARQLQPDYAQMLLPHLADIPSNLQNVLPNSLNRLVSQYRRVFQPVVEAIRSIPEGHCRYRAVCETANHLIRNTQFMSNSLQRLSATVYLNFGTEYSKAWLDGIVNSDCAVKYAQCESSPFSMVAARLADALRPKTA